MKMEALIRPTRAPAAASGADEEAALGPAPRNPALEIAAFLLIVVAPLAMTPFTSSPSFDPKLVIVGIAALIFATRADTFRSRLAVPVALWFAAGVVAAVAGVDRWQSVLGREDQGNGLLLLMACGVSLLAGARLPESIRDRIPGWLLGAGVGAALIGIAARVDPSWFQSATGRPLGAHGGGMPPLGHAVFLGAFLAAAAAAAVPVARRRPSVAAAAVAVLAAGCVVTGKRGPIVFAVAALAVALIRCRLPWRRAALLAAAFLTVAGGLTVADVVRSESAAAPISAARRFDEVFQGSAAQRPAVWTAALRAWSRRPVTGWGPGNTAGATLAAATESEARAMERIWQDAHNMAVGSLVDTGVLGFAALSAVMLMALARLRRGTRATGWALAGIIALALHHAIQPLNLAVTPLFFFLLGIAGSDPPQAGAPRPARSLRPALAAVLSILAVLAVVRFGASTLEASGRRYFSADHAALRASLRLEPLRISTASYLSLQLAIDGKGSPAGELKARRVAAAMVEAHPWDPIVRLAAADVEIMLGHPDRAAVWLDRQLARFPNDALGLAFRGFASIRMGDPEGARPYLERAERINPSGSAKWTPGSASG